LGLNNLTLVELGKMIHKGEVRPHEILIDVFNRIQEVEGKVKSFITLTIEKAYEMAKDAENTIFTGKKILPQGFLLL